MDNNDSSPAITFPNVPDDFCPSGNWQNVFQVFIDEVLSNGTILVPGLGDVTPQQITQINEDLADQQTQISANATNITNLTTQVNAIPVVVIRQGTVTGVVTGDSIIPINFPALPTNSYVIGLTPHVSGTVGSSGHPTIGILQGTKVTNGFSIIVENNISEITQIDWVAIYSV